MHQARNRYSFFASQARKEGFEQIAAIFEETANQEKEHAKRFFSYLQGGDLQITETFPAGKVLTTLENLRAAANGEKHEWTVVYPNAAQVARKEGFEGIAKIFEFIANAEKRHEARYSELLRLVEAKEVFLRSSSHTWRCRNCGYTHDANEAPKACPACAHPQAWFEVAMGLVSL